MSYRNNFEIADSLASGHVVRIAVDLQQNQTFDFALKMEDFK
jgi:hypothetical protein